MVCLFMVRYGVEKMNLLCGCVFMLGNFVVECVVEVMILISGFGGV